MRTLYLHIGQGKTGTSFLQSCLALSRPALAASGIRYPAGLRDRDAASGRMTSGNGHLIRAALKTAAGRRAAGTALRMTGKGARGDILFSSEFFFAEMSGDTSPKAMIDFARHAGCEQIKVLMLIRDPIEHVVSSYLQAVRRGGAHYSLSEAAARFRLPQRTAKVLATYDDPAIEFTVLNYSRISETLIGETAGWLGRDPGIISSPAQARVNRSLTATETAFQRALNARFGKCADIFADEICEGVPDIPRDPPRLSSADITTLRERLAPAIEEVNTRIDPAHAYRVPLDEHQPVTPTPQTFRISRAHLRHLTTLLAAKVRA